jgi:multidrug efflux pump
MMLSDISVRRPVFAAVAAIILCVVGFRRVQLAHRAGIAQRRPARGRHLDDYRGASAEVIEERITELIERQVAGIEGIDRVNSSSRDGASRISISFKLDRNLDDAANDVRDAVSRVTAQLPEQADPPQIQKANADALADHVHQLHVEDDEPAAAVGLRPALPRGAPLDRARRGDVGVAGRSSTRCASGSIPTPWPRAASPSRTWRPRSHPERRAAGRLARGADQGLHHPRAARLLDAAEFARCRSCRRDRRPRPRLRGRGRQRDRRRRRAGRRCATSTAPSRQGYITRLGDIARVEGGPGRRPAAVPLQRPGPGRHRHHPPEPGQRPGDSPTAFAEAIDEINQGLPKGTEADRRRSTTPSSPADAIKEVWITMGSSLACVALVTSCSWAPRRAAIIPTIVAPDLHPVDLHRAGPDRVLDQPADPAGPGLAIGLVVDDAIVVVENIQRRIDEGEPPIVAAQRGARQVFFAVVATTIVLISVFAPLMFLPGFIGRLFVELAVSVAAAVAFSAHAGAVAVADAGVEAAAAGQGRGLAGAQRRRRHAPLKSSYHASLEGLLGRRVGLDRRLRPGGVPGGAAWACSTPCRAN